MENNAKEIKRFLCTDYNVLVAEEDDGARKSVCEMLFEYGISTDEAPSEELAVKLANEHKFDMIFAGGMKNRIGRAQISDGLSADSEVVGLPQDKSELYAFLDERIPSGQRHYIADGDEEDAMPVGRIVRLFMSGVDVLEGIRKNGKIDDYIDLLDLFHMDGMQRINSLADKIENGDFKNYIIEVHGLKSAAANIGAGTLSEMAKQHETSGKDEDYDYIRDNKDALFEVYPKVLNEIERVLRLLQYGRFAKHVTQKLGTIERQEVLERLKQILHHLETFHSKDAAKGVEELLTYSLQEEVTESLEEISNLLRMYEDDKAEEKLNEMIRQF